MRRLEAVSHTIKFRGHWPSFLRNIFSFTEIFLLDITGFLLTFLFPMGRQMYDKRREFTWATGSGPTEIVKENSAAVVNTRYSV